MSIIDYEERDWKKKGARNKYTKIQRLIEAAKVNKEKASAFIEKIKEQVREQQINGVRRKGERFYVYLPLATIKAMAELDVWLNQDGIRSRAELFCMMVEMYLARDDDLMKAIDRHMDKIGKRTDLDKKIRRQYQDAVRRRKGILGEMTALTDEDIVDIFDITEEHFGR